MFFPFRNLTTLHRIWRNPHLNRQKILSYQNSQLRRVIHHAHKNVPYYRDLFTKAKISPQDIKTASDLKLIPLTLKKDLKAQPLNRLLARGANDKNLGVYKTTGSTGIPYSVRRSSFEEFLFHIFRIRIIRNYGLRSNDKVVRIRGDGVGHVPFPWRILQSLGLFKQVRLNTLDPPEKIAGDLLKVCPDILTGYSGVLARVSLAIASQYEQILHPRFMVGGADMLTPLTRRQINTAFESTIFDTYESQEVGPIAWECKEAGKYHVCEDNVILEVIRDESPVREGERGEVVVTSLNCFAMPFIRFCLDDIVTKGSESCSCGQPFSIIEAIEGKKQDFFYLPGGKELYPWKIATVLHDQALWIQQYQLIQEQKDRVVLRAVASPLPSPEVLTTLRRAVQADLGPGVDFRIELVPEIKPGPGGKNWYQTSKVRTLYNENHRIEPRHTP